MLNSWQLLRPSAGCGKLLQRAADPAEGGGGCVPAAHGGGIGCSCHVRVASVNVCLLPSCKAASASLDLTIYILTHHVIIPRTTTLSGIMSLHINTPLLHSKPLSSCLDGKAQVSQTDSSFVFAETSCRSGPRWTRCSPADRSSSEALVT